MGILRVPQLPPPLERLWVLQVMWFHLMVSIFWLQNYTSSLASKVLTSESKMTRIGTYKQENNVYVCVYIYILLYVCEIGESQILGPYLIESACHPCLLLAAWCLTCFRAEPGGKTRLKSRLEKTIPPGHVFYLVVEPTHLKNLSQNWLFPQVRVKMKNIWNHHLVLVYCSPVSYATFWELCHLLSIRCTGSNSILIFLKKWYPPWN